MTSASIAGKIKQIDWSRPSTLALIAANLVPLFGVLCLGWEVFPLLLLFWFENVIIGVFNVLKMLCASPDQPLFWIGKGFVVPFFSFHYGMFTLVHGAILISLFGGAHTRGAGLLDTEFMAQVVIEKHLGWAILGLAVSHGLSFATNYLGQGEYRRASLPQLMTQPYGRVMVLHTTILLGGFLMTALKSPVVGLLLLVLLKLALDLVAHERERQKFAPAGANVVPMTSALAGVLH